MTWLGGIVVVTILLACTFNSIRWINRPMPGFFLWDNLFVPAIADVDWTGYEAHLPFPVRVLAVNGHPVQNAREVYEKAAHVPIGTPIHYTFQRTDTTTMDLSVPTMALSIPEYLWTLGTYLAIGSLLCLLGLVVSALRPDAAAARAMFASGVVWGLYFITVADIVGPGWFRVACLCLQALSPVTLLHLALTFPVERGILKTRPWLLPCLYVGAVPFAVAGNVLFESSFSGLWAFNQAHSITCGVAGIGLIASLIDAFRFPPSAAVRQRTKIAALGGFLAFLLPVTGLALFAFLGVRFPLNFLVLPLATFPVSIGYAIVKHDLFEVDAIIRRTVSWAILTALIAAIYLGGVGTMELLTTRGSNRFAQLLFLLTIVAVFNPLRDRVQRTIDYLFARDRYDYGHTVGEASRALAALLDLDAIVDRILHTITEAMHVEFSAMWIQHDDELVLHAVAGREAPSTLPRILSRSTPLVKRLAERPHSLVTDDEEDFSATLQERRAMLVVPVAFEHRLSGFLVLGGKESGQFYSREDIGLLNTLANQGAVALENARSYEGLRRANEELRTAQSKLIEAERLAAIGELSAAVAHGIRNPLAGIKAAAQFARLDLEPDHPLQESIHDIVSEADKLEARIKTLLDFSKPFEPQPRACRIETIIDSAATSLRGQATAQNVRLDVHAANDLPEMNLDAAQIEEVLLALIGNAIEVLPDGGLITIHAVPTPSRKSVRIEVADTGPGIPPERIDRVFKLFFTTKSSGTGFGLAVAKKVIERHGGTIRAESPPGEGARFIIELPIRGLGTG